MNQLRQSKKSQASINELIEVFDSQFFKALSEPVRIEILKFLLMNGRSDVSAVAKCIKKHRSVVSRHLHVLHGVGLLNHEKIARNSFFEIDAGQFRDKVYSLFSKVDRAIQTCCP